MKRLTERDLKNLHQYERMVWNVLDTTVWSDIKTVHMRLAQDSHNLSKPRVASILARLAERNFLQQQGGSHHREYRRCPFLSNEQLKAIHAKRREQELKEAESMNEKRMEEGTTAPVNGTPSVDAALNAMEQSVSGLVESAAAVEQSAQLVRQALANQDERLSKLETLAAALDGLRS